MELTKEQKKLLDEIGNLQAEYTKTLKKYVKEEDMKGHVSAELEKRETEISKKMTEIELELAKIKGIEDELSTMKQKANYDPSGKKEEDSEKRKALLNNVLRKGLGMENNRPMDLSVLSKEEQELFGKSLISGSNQDLGFMTTNEMASEIVRLEKERSPVRSLVTVMTGSGPAWEQPVQTERFTALRVGETDSRTETGTGELQMQTISAEELFALPFVSQTMLDDANFDLVGYLNSEISDEFTIKEGTEFVLGNGVKQFRGITTYEDGTGFNQLEQVESTTAGEIAYEDFVNLDELILPGFQNLSWLMRRTTRAAARKLLDGELRPLLQPDLPSGGLPQIFGKPIIDVPDMPLIGAGGSGNLPIAFGDFRRSYLVYDRMGIRILRDPFTNKPFVLFYTTKRSGGDVINHQGIKLLRTK